MMGLVLTSWHGFEVTDVVVEFVLVLMMDNPSLRNWAKGLLIDKSVDVFVTFSLIANHT